MSVCVCVCVWGKSLLFYGAGVHLFIHFHRLGLIFYRTKQVFVSMSTF